MLQTFQARPIVDRVNWLLLIIIETYTSLSRSLPLETNQRWPRIDDYSECHLNVTKLTQKCFTLQIDIAVCTFAPLYFLFLSYKYGIYYRLQYTYVIYYIYICYLYTNRYMIMVFGQIHGMCFKMWWKDTRKCIRNV